MKIVVAHFGTHYVDNPGGVEKVVCNLSNAMVARGHQVTILYRDRQEGNPYFPLDKRVTQYNILFENGRQVVSERLPGPLRVLREAARLFSKKQAQGINAKFKGKQYGERIKQYLIDHPADVILSCSVPSTKYVVDDAACTIPVIQMIHSHPRTLFPTLSKVERNAVKKCRAMQILLPSGLPVAHRYFPDLPVTVIGNAVFPAKKKAAPGRHKERYLITCVGSLTPNKRQHLLCEAFGKLAAAYPAWDVELWGFNGKYGARIQNWIDKHGLSQRIFIKGETACVEEVYAQSDIFCLPSRAEGWGLGLTEAMAAGVPVVGFQGCTGVEDLIQPGITGLLAENGNVDSLAEALRTLMDDPQKRKILGKQASEEMKQYAPEKIWNAWEELLRHVSSGK